MLEKKKILCISVMEHWGGGEEFLLKLAMNVTDYEFIIATPSGEPLNVFKQNGIKTVHIKNLKKYYQNTGSWSFLLKIKILFNIKITTIKLIGVILNHKIDLILANGNFAGIYSLPSAFLTKRRFVVIQHLIYKKDSLEARILKILNRHSDKLICISESVSENVKDILGENKKNNFEVIRHGIDMPALNEIDKKIIPNKVEISIGIIGSIIRLKAIDMVIEAAKEIIIQNPKIHLHIYGSVRSDEPDSIKYEGELKKLIIDNNLSDNIHFHGFEKSKDQIYSNLDIVVNYSKVPESFSLTVLEALSFGKIVIASDIGGPKELITNNENGFLIPPSNKNTLKGKLEFCISNLNSVEFDRIKKCARKTAEEKFSLQSFSSDYKNFFDSILSTKRKISF